MRVFSIYIRSLWVRRLNSSLWPCEELQGRSGASSKTGQDVVTIGGPVRWVMVIGHQTANSDQRTVDSEQWTADSGQRTADSGQLWRIANGKQQTACGGP